MKVTTSFGYVEIKNYIPRKADNIYNSILFASMSTKTIMPVAKKTLDKEVDQKAVEEEAGNLLNPMQLIEASQARAYEMIEKIAVVKADNTEEEVQKTTAWWDECNKLDVKAIEEAVAEVAKEKDEEVKK